ncbi:hypothetical protein FQA39_LY07788 [Lamprigera yunnana]|nr:hypothetical protein FQA39_LY07788 [Lamprigera yunnana]
MPIYQVVLLHVMPRFSVLQDVVVKTADNVANLPGNLVEDVKSGNPLNVIKSTLKVLPLVDESLVDRAVNAVQDRIENLPNTIVEGVKQGANLLNTTTAVTGNLIGNVVKPLGNVVSNGLEKGASLINTTGHIVGKVAKPLVGVVGTGFKGVLDLANATGQVTKKVIDTTTGTLDLLNPANLINKLLLTLGLPVLIVIGVVVLIVVLCFLGLCTWGIVSCVKSKKNSNTKSVYKSEKPSITIKEDVEASQKLLSDSCTSLYNLFSDAYEDNQVAQNLRQLPDAILPQQWIEDEVGELRNTRKVSSTITIRRFLISSFLVDKGVEQGPDLLNEIVVEKIEVGTGAPNANGATRNVTGTLTNGTATNFVDDLASTFSLPGAISILSAMGVLVVFCLGVCIFYVYKYIKTDKKFSSDSEETEKLLPKVLPTE